MSSLKKSTMCQGENCSVSHGLDDSHVSKKAKNRNMPPILRLDSTGEDTSHNFGVDKSRGCVRNCELTNKMNRSFQNLFNYVGAASSSLSDLGSGIANHLTPDRTSPFECVRKMFHVSEVNFDGNTRKNNMADTRINQSWPQFGVSPRMDPRHGNDTYPYFKKQLSSWSNSVLGAFHRKTPLHAFQKHCYYSPYQGQSNIWQNKKKSNFSNCDEPSIDPHLKPYNARLLQKSRQSKKYIPTSQQNCHSKECNKQTIKAIALDTCTSGTVHHDRKKDKQKEEVKSRSVDIKDQSVSDISTSVNSINAIYNDVIENSHMKGSECITAKKIKNGNSEMYSKEKQDNSQKDENVTDWFEYERKDLKTIPISLKSVDQKCKLTGTVSGSDYAFIQPSLHSCLSIDTETDNVPCKSENLTNSQLEENYNGQIDENSEKRTHHESGDDKLNEKSCDIQKINLEVDKTNQCPKSESEPPDDTEHLCESDKSFVLYVRNISSAKRSSKPSCKKRRRQRAKKDCKTDKNHANNFTKKADEKSDKCKDSPIAFILGIDTEAYSAGEAQPFLVSCDINSDSDWSDSENECEESPEEPVPDELSLITLCDKLSPLNFQVTCSVQSSPTQSSSYIDSINLSWQVNVCVSSATQNKKQSSKKVKNIDLIESQH